ncbi:bifunctional UDP-N-acetylglucosamine diphosphorylase/glucosamine-1-phosphate N-acetyltransferase GlmU [Pseudobdellovibrio exovorus]|uniref:Bifunctional protein GlmU n=1 Tax=Pseudobdellovibrio exovorus JSS TaxID=1184267 RepID=M4VAX9_9BACT|nr:bifunctional UDP-N-acetylglucosamine diphosphorylase/glucosamine-1-phosphate N-acetyltransferase GlmU [Pseudobdellovibrio exovorus]AGH96378.1 UDP-N-acetylglucosamine pyrophosphorylase / diamine N-acetyltransferase [Pseudobdellovibrio exovorus JSS]
MEFTAIILAGGQGTRMKSPLPKVLHPVAGQPMIARVIGTCRQAGITQVRVVVGHGQSLVKTVLEPLNVSTHVQEQQLGTANAVQSANLESLETDVIIMNGDHPLITDQDLKNFISDFKEQQLDLAVITVELDNPAEFGRIVRKHDQLVSIVEAKDASMETLKIREVNTGIYLAKASVLKKYIPLIKNNNSKKEFYLTDLIDLALTDRLKVQALLSKNTDVAHGVNNQAELAEATKKVFQSKTKKLMENGVIFIDPQATHVEEGVIIGAGSVIYPGAFIRGKTAIGAFTVIEPNCFISDSIIGDSVHMKAGSYIEQVIIKNKASVGPYARLRPETTIGESAHVGNFVEMKKVNFGNKSKAGHLTYLGDAEIGEDVNIGCGTITCNYAADKKKYKTVIGDRVFVGSDTQLVAPVTVESDSLIASGTTVTKNVPAGALALSRSPQVNKEGYAKKFQKKSES